MANRSLSTPSLKENEDTLATREALSSEELQMKLEKIIKMLSVVNNEDVSDFGSLDGDQELPPYHPFVKSTYTSARPQFLRYRHSRKDDDEDPLKKYEGMERCQTSPCSKIMILLLVAALFVFIFCISAWHSGKLYADLNLQALNKYVDRFGLPISEKSEELDLSINEYADELGPSWHSSQLYGGLNLQTLNEYAGGFALSISENSEKLDLLINEYADELGLLIKEDSEESGLRINDGDEAHGLAIPKQFGTPEFESTYNFAAHSTILIGLPGTLALESPNHMEAVISEGKKAKEWVLEVLVSEDPKHLEVLYVLLVEDSKHLGAVSSSISIESLGSALLCAVTGALCCAAAVAIYMYKKSVKYACPKTSLESVKEIKAKKSNRTLPLEKLSKMQTKGSSVPSVQLLNEYSPAEAVSSSCKKNINMWNNSSIPGNSFHLPNQEVRRKGSSASTTNKENMISGEIFLENSSHGSLTTMAKKDKDKKQQKVMPVRKSERILRCHKIRAVM